MSLIFYNPQIDDFLGEPPHFKIFNRRPLKKYGFLLEETIKREGEIKVLYDDTISVFIPSAILFLFPKFIRRLITYQELKYWIKINNLTRKVKIYDEEFTPDDNDVLFFFSYKIAVTKFHKRLSIIEKFKVKIGHLSHYFVATSLKAKNLSQISNLYLAGDSEISKNEYFKHHFSWYRSEKIIVLPFVVGDRFKPVKSFSDRQPKFIATGSFHNLEEEKPAWKYKDFTSFFKMNTYHPIRKYIYYNKEALSDIIDCKISPYREGKKSFFRNLLNKFSISQKSYFSFDIVDLYNNYQFAIIGEELSGFPAIGVLEAMACGCIVFVQEGYYNGFDLENNKHVFFYDGNVAKLKSTIASKNNESKIFLEMSQEASEFGRNFNKQYVYNNFHLALADIIDNV